MMLRQILFQETQRWGLTSSPSTKTRDKLHLFPFTAASNNAAINIPVINDSLLFPQIVPSRILYTFTPSRPREICFLSPLS